MKLLSLRNSLVPKDIYETFDMNNICAIVDKLYPTDFSDNEKISLDINFNTFILMLLVIQIKITCQLCLNCVKL